ncbi:MAG: glycosyltransferase [Bacteroidales bacterium]|nr:glycosyltransferase [Bacteroidales bacterium]
MNDGYQPLVSVAVITYNSSKTVVETLDSIYNQTYPNLELIVSDDCSSDNTVEICRDWIEAHKDRFVRTELLTVEKNTGVSANMNRGADACQGEWVKDIAGDDVLLPDCVETYVDYVGEHQEAVYVFANVKLLGGDEETRRYVRNCYSDMDSFFNMSIDEQYDYLTLNCNPIYAATTFYNRDRVISLGIRNDERIPLEEDRAKWINCLKAGVRFCYINRATALYRMSDSSLCRNPVTHSKAVAQVYLYYCFRNDYKKRDKKNAVLRWIRSQRTVHDNAFVWRIICKLYRVVFRIE